MSRKCAEGNNMDTPYKNFTLRLELLLKKYPELITLVLSNIFTMRIIGNKTHGDLAEIAIAEFINQYMYDFSSRHVGKELYRAKEHEEDILILDEIKKVEFPVSIKAYGKGPLQLSTDKSSLMFSTLQNYGHELCGNNLEKIFADSAFQSFDSNNILPLIYSEKEMLCNILVFNAQKAKQATSRIVYEAKGNRRKHPVYRFYDAANKYICEVRYGDATANALQRGLWTHTENAGLYFDSLTGGWITYAHHDILVQLFPKAFVASEQGHQEALRCLEQDIQRLRHGMGK